MPAELIKTNLYVSTSQSPPDNVLLAKTNLYISTRRHTFDLLLAKTNLYISENQYPGVVARVAKTNLYASISAIPFGEFVTMPFVDNTSDSESYLGAISLIIDEESGKFTLREMERNPYRAHIADDEETRWKDYREQQRILRQQHNITQAGDSTFDYGLLLKTYPNEEFTLGSLGRFFHDDHGIILARFCQFVDCVEYPWQGQPVGRRKFNSATVDWIVTNNLEKTDRDLIQGFTFFAETPPDDYYGWVVVCGCNPASIRVTTSRIPQQNDPYTWTTLNGIGLDSEGTICARWWGVKPESKAAPAGSLFIRVEGRSDASLEILIREMLADELEAIAALQGLATEFTDRLNGLDSSITSLQAYDEVLTARIAAEELLRARQIQALSNQIVQVDIQALIDDAMVVLRGEFQAADSDIYALALSAKNLAESLQTTLNGFDIAGLTAQVTSITDVLNVIMAGLRGFSAGFGFGATPTASEILLIYVFTEDVDFPDDFVGSVAQGITNPTGTFVLDVLRDAAVIGTISIDNAGAVTFATTGTGTESFVIGESLRVRGPAGPDATIANWGFTFFGTRV